MTVIKKFPNGEEHADFQYDFALEGKGLQTDVDENGDLWIEGYASDFGLDRQDEAFEPGAFERGLKAFLDTNPIMLYHHQYDKALGQFAEARVDENGLWVRGRVDAPAPGSWAEDVFNKIRKGTIKAFSVGGIFKRRMTPNGPKIYEADLGEISVTPFPVNPRTVFALAAKKAFENVEGKAGEEDEHEEAREEGGIVPEAAPAVDDKPSEEEAQEAARKEAEALAAAEATGDGPAFEANSISAESLIDGSITSEKIAANAIGPEHLSDALRSHFQELAPEVPTVEQALEAISRLETTINSVATHAGYDKPKI